MRVKWTYYMPLSSIPEMYWGEDLSLMDSDYEGEVIGSGDSFWDGSYLLVACDDGKIRKCPTNAATTVKPKVDTKI